jgi:hypothetical protein
VVAGERPSRGVGGGADAARRAASPRHAQALAEVRAETCAILRELCFGVPSFADTLAACAPLAPRLCVLCADADTFPTASALLEEVATASPATLRIADLPRFPALVRSLGAAHLAVFVRVLALLVYENAPPPRAPGDDAPGAPPLLRAERDAPRYAEANHTALLEIPELLPRMVKLLRLPALPALGAGALSSRVAAQLLAALPPTAQSVIPQLLGLVLSRHADGWDAEDARATADAAPAPLDAAPAPPAPQGLGALPPAPAPHLSEAAGAHQVEVLYLLCALLGGPAKAQVQDALAAAGLVPALERLFGAIDWAAPAPAAPALPFHTEPDGLHGPGCTCNPANALKLQFLRTVHAFLERDADNRRNKRLLLSPADLLLHYREEADAVAAALRPAPAAAPAATQPSVLSAMAAARRRLTNCVLRAAVPRVTPPQLPLPLPLPLPPPPPPPAAAAPTGGACGGTGLMGKLLSRLVAEPPGSPHRFWLASCAEAFLRGSRAAEQRFAAAGGLLPHLLEDILADGPKPQGALQISCDLLGELLKYNRGLFAELDTALAAAPGRLQRLTGVLMAQLVDSNVLLRAVALSVEAFSAADAAAAAAAAGGGAQDGCAEPLADSDGDGDASCCSEGDADALGAWPPAGSDAPGAPPRAGALGAWLCREWLGVLEALMSAVAAHEVDQESICVVNTSLIFLIFTRRTGRLPAALAALRARRRPPGDPRPGPCAGFAALLGAWRGHYTGRSRDCASLEFSTGVPFAEWSRCVEALLGSPTSELSLYYQPPAA